MAAILAACSLFATSCRNAERVLPAVAPETDCSQFVVITDVVPDAILEIRYYSTYNFVGARVDGYEEPLALMTRQATDSPLGLQSGRLGHEALLLSQRGQIKTFRTWLHRRKKRPFARLDCRPHHCRHVHRQRSGYGRCVRLVWPRKPSRLRRQPRNYGIPPQRHPDRTAVCQQDVAEKHHDAPRVHPYRLRVVALHTGQRTLQGHLFLLPSEAPRQPTHTTVIGKNIIHPPEPVAKATRQPVPFV